MTALQNWPADVHHHFLGHVSFVSMDIAPGTIVDSDVNDSADISASKLEHMHRPHLSQTGEVTNETRIVHVTYGAAGTIQSFQASVVTAAVGNSHCRLMLQNNGVDILTTSILIDSSVTAYSVKEGTLDDATLEAEEVLGVKITVSPGTGTLPTGVHAEVVLHEDAS
jgi:hypothetical protein